MTFLNHRTQTSLNIYKENQIFLLEIFSSIQIRNILNILKNQTFKLFKFLNCS